MTDKVSGSEQAGAQAVPNVGSPTTAAPAAPTSGGDPAAKAGFGLSTATALIIGSIIGVGIFNLPTSLASYGPISLVSMGLTTIGALALAMLFAALSRRLPADGGPYAYARIAYGNMWGFTNAWSYWITAWAGNAAIAVGWVLYVEQFINAQHRPQLPGDVGAVLTRRRRLCAWHPCLQPAARSHDGAGASSTLPGHGRALRAPTGTRGRCGLMRTRALAPAAVAVVALALAGCGRLNRAATINQVTTTPGAAAATALEQKLASQGLSGAQVTCAKAMIVNVGTSNSCTVTHAGKSKTVRFTFSSSDGAIASTSVKTS
jgi:amino acid transporter